MVYIYYIHFNHSRLGCDKFNLSQCHEKATFGMNTTCIHCIVYELVLAVSQICKFFIVIFKFHKVEFWHICYYIHTVYIYGI